MRNLESRLEKLEKIHCKKPEKLIIHRVIWDGEEPPYYLINGKLYPNDGNIAEALIADNPQWANSKDCIKVLWEPIYSNE